MVTDRAQRRVRTGRQRAGETFGFINYSKLAIDLKVEYKNTDHRREPEVATLSSASDISSATHEVVQLGNILATPRWGVSPGF